MMECFAGDTIVVRSRAANPVTLQLLTDGTSTASLFNPSLDPENVPGDRAHPDHTAALSWDDVSRYYLATVSTTGYAPGIWTVQIQFSDSQFASETFFQFTVKS